MNKTSLFRVWIQAARLRTLPLSVAGILTGNALALDRAGFSWIVFSGTLLTAVCFQILSNFANDYGDGIKGTEMTIVLDQNGYCNKTYYPHRHCFVVSYLQLS